MKIGAITIGQAPRTDVTADILRIFDDSLELVQAGGLDGLTKEEIAEFAPAALDGGRLVFLIIEAIRRKPVNREIEGRIHFAGLMLLMALMVVVMYNDILKIF